MFEVVDKIYSPDPFPPGIWGFGVDGRSACGGGSLRLRLGPLQGMVGIHRKLKMARGPAPSFGQMILKTISFWWKRDLSGDRLLWGLPVWSDPTITPPSAKIYVFKKTVRSGSKNVDSFADVPDSTLGLSWICRALNSWPAVCSMTLR